MVQFLENNYFWKKLLNEQDLDDLDFEKYLYSQEYLNLSEENLFKYQKDEYNPNLFKYFFAAKPYKDYDEIFFQNFLDGGVSKKEYLKYENSMIDMYMELFSTNKTYVDYVLTDTLRNNILALNSKDVLYDFASIENKQGKCILIQDKNLFMQICYLSIREVCSVEFYFPDFKAIFLPSGLHGLILTENALSNDLIDSLNEHVTVNLVNKPRNYQID